VPAIHLLISALYLCACGLFILFVLLTFPVCIFPSSFFMRLTFSSISSSISYLPEYGPAPFPGWRSLEATAPGFSVFCIDIHCIFS